jgi:hypothetical protein
LLLLIMEIREHQNLWLLPGSNLKQSKIRRKKWLTDP